MNFVFKIMVFSIMLNVSAGVVLLAIPELGSTYNLGISSDINGSTDFIDGMSTQFNPESQLQNKDDATIRYLDMLNIGIIFTFLKSIPTLMFGFVMFFDNLFGAMLGAGMRTLIVGFMYTFMGIAYIFGGIYLVTGRELFN